MTWSSTCGTSRRLPRTRRALRPSSSLSRRRPSSKSNRLRLSCHTLFQCTFCPISNPLMTSQRKRPSTVVIASQQDLYSQWLRLLSKTFTQARDLTETSHIPQSRGRAVSTPELCQSRNDHLSARPVRAPSWPVAFWHQVRIEYKDILRDWVRNLNNKELVPECVSRKFRNDMTQDTFSCPSAH